MQESSLRQVKYHVLESVPLNEKYLHFPLKGILPDGHVLVLNTVLGTLSQLAVSDDGPELIRQQQFTESEVSILLPLFKSFPHYCPYEEILAYFGSTHVTEQSIDRARLRLQEAQLAGIWDIELRSLRNVLSRARLKIHTFDVDIVAILETGYVLMNKSKRKKKK